LDSNHTWQKSGTKVEYYIEAYDKLGNKALSKFYNYTVRETIPPSLEIKTPSNNSFVKGIVNVSIATYDPSGIERVKFYINGELAHIDYNTPYEWIWNTTLYKDGTYTLEIKTYDIFLNINTTKIIITVDNTPPTISNVYHPSEIKKGENAIINATIKDNLSDISKVILS